MTTDIQFAAYSTRNTEIKLTGYSQESATCTNSHHYTMYNYSSKIIEKGIYKKANDPLGRLVACLDVTLVKLAVRAK